MSTKTYLTSRRLRRRGISRFDGTVQTDTGSTIDITIPFLTIKEGEELPKWRDWVKQRVNATNPYSGRFISVIGGRGMAYASYYVAVNFEDHLVEDTFQGWMGGTPNTSFATASSFALNSAKAAFSKKAAAKISPFAGGVFLGELREAIHMIHNPAEALFKDLYRYLRDVKKRVRRTKNRRRYRDIVAGTWLEYVFGWAPLISDVKSGAEALSQVMNQFRPNEKVQVTVPDKAVVQTPTVSLRSFNNVGWYETTSIIDEVSTRLEGAVNVGPADTFAGKLETFGISWGNVLPTAWELIPFSFITDYFTNVGDIISAASLVNARLVWASSTDKSRRVNTVNGFSPQTGLSFDRYKSRVDAGKAQVITTVIQRGSVASIVPSLTFTCPGLKSGKWLNIGALFAAASKS